MSTPGSTSYDDSLDRDLEVSHMIRGSLQACRSLRSSRTPLAKDGVLNAAPKQCLLSGLAWPRASWSLLRVLR